jgi:4-carboxymuconolactone decarboxylase
MTNSGDQTYWSLAHNKYSFKWAALTVVCIASMVNTVANTQLINNPKNTEEIHMNKDAFDNGLATRRAVLGADYVDNSIKNADDFNMPMQELVTEYCWDSIWNRPGLDRKTRSMLNLAMLTALNRPHELRLHVRGAINNGLTKDEIKEVLLQTAIYCGVPAAIDSFKNAKEVLKEMGI